LSGQSPWNKQIQAWSVDSRAGATEIARGCALALISYSDQAKPHSPQEIGGVMTDICRKVLKNHASMAPVVRLLNDILLALADVDSVRLALDTLRRVSNEYIALVEQANTLVVEQALAIIPRHGTVMTVSYSSAVARALVLASKEGCTLKVVCMESRPGYEGRDLARFLADAGIDTLLIVDSACLSVLVSTDLTLVGADAMTSKGVVNKIGTATLALGANARGIPAYVMGDTSKIWPASLGDPPVPLRDTSEVWAHPAPGVKINNFYYETAPWEHFSGVVTERGVAGQDLITEIGARIDLYPQLREFFKG
jgi:translation initiation factor 2B subunit (eIF-2B alpha/beta/delta family)